MTKTAARGRRGRPLNRKEFNAPPPHHRLPNSAISEHPVHTIVILDLFYFYIARCTYIKPYRLVCDNRRLPLIQRARVVQMSQIDTFVRAVPRVACFQNVGRYPTVKALSTSSPKKNFLFNGQVRVSRTEFTS